MSSQFLRIARGVHATRNLYSNPFRSPRFSPIVLRTTNSHTTRLQFHRTFANTPRTMASDEDYASFLDKANQDPSEGRASTQSTKKASTKSVNTEVPKALEEVEVYFTSDADEPFEPVSLKWEGDGVPSADELGSLIGKDASSISQKDFDPQNQYKKVIDAVKKAASADLGYFLVELGGTRSEYYVVGVDKKGNRLVGMKAVAVQS